MNNVYFFVIIRPIMEITRDWQYYKRVTYLKQYITNDILECGGIIYGGYVRDYQRFELKFDSLDDPTKDLIIHKMYDCNVDPESWHWRKPKPESDIDCIMTEDIFAEWEECNKIFYGIVKLNKNEPNHRYNWTKYCKFIYRIKLLGFDIRAISLDVTIIKDNFLDKHLDCIAKTCDFDINSLIMSSKKSTVVGVEPTPRGELEDKYTIKYGVKKITRYPITVTSVMGDMELINKHLLEDTAEINNLKVCSRFRLYKILENNYKKVIISYNGTEPIYIMIMHCDFICKLCEKNEKSYLIIHTRNKYFHINCYINYCYENNKDHLGLYINQEEYLCSNNNIEPQPICEYTFDGSEGMKNLCSLYNTLKRCEII